MKKRITAVVAVCAVLLSFTGCGKQSELETGLKMIEQAAAEAEKEASEEAARSEREASRQASREASKAAEIANAEEIDPFEGVDIEYTGMAPNGKAAVKGGNGNVTYSVTPDKNLKNGDTVTVKAELRPGVTAYKLSGDEKEFTVDGLAGYVTALDEIPQETKDKMEKQADDLITAFVADQYDDNASLKSKQLLGYYFLTPKEGFEVGINNEVYLVYKFVSTLNTKVKSGDDYKDKKVNASSYTYVRFRDITSMPDGTCSVDLSNGYLYQDRFETEYISSVGWGINNWYLYGYKDIDSMFNAVIAKNIASYNYENTVKEDATTSETTSDPVSSTADSSSAQSSKAASSKAASSKTASSD